jgi:hypothetical protein
MSIPGYSCATLAGSDAMRLHYDSLSANPMFHCCPNEFHKPIDNYMPCVVALIY